MKFFIKKSREEKFWNWFEKNSEWISGFEANLDAVFAALQKQLGNYDSGLAFEFSVEKNGVREIIISAEGIFKNFPAVSNLVSAAPKMAGWKVIGFRPRVAEFSEALVKFGDFELNPHNVIFGYNVEGGKLDLFIHHPEMTPENKDELIGALFILLDTALGEYDVCTGIDQIVFLTTEDKFNRDNMLSLVMLPDIYDAAVASSPIQ